MAASVPPSELRRMVHPQRDDHHAFIEEQAAKLVALGVPRGHFESATYNAHGIFKQYNDDDAKLERVLKLGTGTTTDNKYFETIRGCQPGEFYAYVRHLRSRAGQEELANLSFHEKLLKRGEGHFTAQQMAYIAMFDAQRADMLNRARDVRRHHDGIIAELEGQLRVARAMKDEELEVLYEEPAAKHDRLNSK